jgi:uncharacterized lipoprotein YmbA
MTQRRARTGRLLAGLGLLLALGCASSPPTANYYLLRGNLPESGPKLDEILPAGLGSITVAPYLTTSLGIVVETDEGRIQPAVNHLWAEPLDAGLRWYLRDEIGREVGFPIGSGIRDRLRWPWIIDVVVSRLHATMEGRAVIDARFAIVSREADGPFVGGHVARSIPIPEAGYAGVVAAEKALLRELAREIARQLGPLVEP